MRRCGAFDDDDIERSRDERIEGRDCAGARQRGNADDDFGMS